MKSLQELENSWDFGELNYDQQVQVREAYYRKVIAQDPSLKSMSKDQVASIYNATLFRAPVVNDKVLQSEINNLWKKAKDGDQGAIDQMKKTVLYGKYRTNSALVSFFDKFLISPLLNKSLDTRETPELEQSEVTVSPDAGKIINGFDLLLDQKVQNLKAYRLQKTAASIGGAVTDFAILFPTIAGVSLDAAKGAGLIAKGVQAAVQGGTTASKAVVLGRLAGEATHAAVTASIGLAREWSLEALNNELKDSPGFQEAAVKSAKWFGEYFAGDLVVNWFLGVALPMGKLGLKGGIKGYGDVSHLYKNLNQEQFKKLTQMVFSGEDLPKDFLSSLPDVVQREALSTSTLVKTLRNVEDIPAEDLAILVAKHNGFNAIKTVDGLEVSRIGAETEPVNLGKLVDKMDPKKFNPTIQIEEALPENVKQWKMPTVKNYTRTYTRDKNIVTVVDRNVHDFMPPSVQTETLTFKSAGDAMDFMKKNPGPKGYPWEEIKTQTKVQPVKIQKKKVSLPKDQLQRKNVTLVNSTAELNDFISKQLSDINPIFKKTDIQEFAKRASIAPGAKLNMKIKGVIPESQLKNADVLSRLAAPVNGEFKQENLNSFVKAFAKGNGAEEEMVKRLKVLDKGGELIVQSNRGVIMRIPKGKLTPGKEVEILGDLTKRLNELTGEGKGIVIGGEFIDRYTASLVKQNLFTPSWMAKVAFDQGEILFQQEGKWFLRSIDGLTPVQQFDSLEEVGSRLIRDNISVDMVKQSAERMGYRLTGSQKNEKFFLREGSRVVAEGSSVDEILQQVPSIFPKIDSRYGPQFTLIKDTGIFGVQFNADSVAIANYPKMMKFLDKFQKKSAGQRTVSLTGGSKGRIEYHHMRKQFEVEIPDLAERRTFENVKQAKEYLEGGYKETQEAYWTALKKGYRMQYRMGKWELYTNDGNIILNNNFDDVTKVLKEVPVPEWAPELSGLPEELVAGFELPPQGFFMPKEITSTLEEGSPLEYTVLSQFSTFWAPPKTVLEKFVAQGGDSEVLQVFNDIERARNFIIGREGEMRKVILSIFDDGSGKVLPKKTRKWIGSYIEAPDNEKAKVIQDALQDKVTLGKKELEAAGKLRDFYGTTPETGAFQYFGVNPEKFLKDYLPKIKKFYYQNPKKVFTDGNHAYIAQAFNLKAPRELDAFFKHSRVSDVLDMALEDDPLAQLFRYTNTGLKEKYLGPLIERAKSLPSLAQDEVMRKRLYHYLQQIGGLPQGNAQEIIRQVTPRILQTFGLSPTLTNDITSWFMSLGYSASMGFRPWLPIRNMNQIWTTLAMRMQGNEWVKRALKDVSGEGGEAIFDTLRKKGVIMSALPLFGSEVIDQTSLLGKITHKSLKLYKNSDDFTRAVAYQSATLKFNDAFGAIKSKRISLDEFLHASGVSQIDPVSRARILKQMDAGNIAGARDLYATQIVTETMFPYRSGMAPYAFSGTVGKMFGMMGHYPVYYVDNIRRSLKYMTTGEKVLAGSIMVGNSMALYGAFRAIGVKATNFQPQEPAIFTGGPAWEIMQDSLAAIGTGSEGKAARARLFGLSSKNGRLSFNPLNSTFMKWTVPGAFELKKMEEATNLMNDGDSYGAFLTLMGAPYSSDWEVLNP